MSSELFSLAGKTALVTGGTRGIGQAMAIGLAEAGADIILVVRSTSPSETKKAVEALNRKCYTFTCDMTDRAAVAGLVPAVTAAHRVDILVNVAGILNRIPAVDYPLEVYDNIMQTNLTSTFQLCQAMGRYWLENGFRGKIVNTASLTTFTGSVNLVAYAMSKGAVGQLTKALSNEWASKGINVNAVAPGYIATDMNIDTRITGDPAYLKSLNDRIPAGRWGDPEDFKGPVVFLCSKASDYVHGDILLLSDKSLFISSALYEGKWHDTEKTFEVFDPVTGKAFSKVANLDRPAIKAAIQSAKEAQQKYYWSTTAAQRGASLRRWFDLCIANKKDLATILCLENGKTFSEAEGEVVYAASFISWFSEEAVRSYGDVIPSSTQHTTIMTLKQPIGVCGIITPWNFPAAMITRKIAPALAAGCAVVIKPPSETPHTALALAKLAIDAGIPAECIQVCPTKDREAATELATSELVNKISFTGSTNVGKMLAKLAAGTLKRVSLELGGNAPFIVFEDADLDLAVEGAMICKFRCSGQTCVCANRLLVHKSVAAAFAAKLVARVSALQMGSGFEPATTQGPLVNDAAVKKVAEHVHDALAKGAKVATGGSPPPKESLPGFFFTPTILTGVTTEMQVARDETFGPLAPIFEFETEAEAIALANGTEFGLAGYFFSKNIGRIMRVATRLECGMVGVNTGKISAAETPFGGIKESGYGREGSKYGMAEYEVIKSVTIGNLDH
ncbi:Aldehyde/histidinol dehydrogenase [Niveomyces insectorum RCEF 264]|uniref:Succinate-semialdehyde dehydrogenase, mitochondrial n=1 Tax=Niveomyces insectorum RCEF 264 TaxID=1081102 RepID=A0A167XU55_9HYPO|nr:Aldehyde/histidinol dehydrogenase [Niveomyces insectorum RCEF 264]